MSSVIFLDDAAIGDSVNDVLSIVMSNFQNGFLLPNGMDANFCVNILINCCFTEVKTFLFESEQDHLTPSTLRLLLESDFFVVARLIIDYSFLKGDPGLVFSAL